MGPPSPASPHGRHRGRQVPVAAAGHPILTTMQQVSLPPADGQRPGRVRVLFASHTFPPDGRPLASIGGMQRVATELCAALGQQPLLEVRACALRSADRWVHARMPAFLARLLVLAERLRRQGGLDAILFSSVTSAALLAPVLTHFVRRGVRLAAIAHGDDVVCPAAGYQVLVRAAMARLDAVAAVSAATGAACLQRGLPSQRLRVIPNGIDVARFEPLGRFADERTQMQLRLRQYLPTDAFLLCSVGRHVPRKGFAWFVEQVMPRLPTSVHFWLAGHGPQTAQIRRAVARHDLQGRVRLLGRLPEPDLLRLYRGADLFVMPNVAVAGTMEGFGVVLLEAGLCGLPAVAASLEGIRDVVCAGSGLLVASGDADAFAQAIVQYQADAERRQLAARQAVQRSRSLAWCTVAQSHAALLCELVHRQGLATQLSSGRHRVATGGP